MSSEILTYKIKTLYPEANHTTILEAEFSDRKYPNIAEGVEQIIESAKAVVLQSVVWSQGHLIAPPYFIGSQRNYLKEDLSEYVKVYPQPTRRVSEIMEFIDSNRKKTSTENPHIPEVDTAYKIGYEAASEVLEMEPLKTATVLANANLTPERIEQIDQQVVSLCGYYTAYEALHSKKTTAKDFPGNPFALFLHLIKDGARNFDLSEFDSKGIVKAEIFVQKENDVIPYTWTGSNRKNIYYNK